MTLETIVPSFDLSTLIVSLTFSNLESVATTHEIELTLEAVIASITTVNLHIDSAIAASVETDAIDVPFLLPARIFVQFQLLLLKFEIVQLSVLIFAVQDFEYAPTLLLSLLF